MTIKNCHKIKGVKYEPLKSTIGEVSRQSGFNPFLESSGYKEFYNYTLKGMDFDFTLTDFSDIKSKYAQYIRAD